MGKFKELSGTRKVYSRSLIVGVSYIANIWCKRKNPILPITGRFIGYGSNLENTKSYIPILNSIPNNSSIYLDCNGDIYEFKIRDKAVWFNVDGIDRRVTFSYDEASFNTSPEHKSKIELKENKILEKSNKQKNSSYKIFDHMKKFNPNGFELSHTTRENIFERKLKKTLGISKVDNISDIIKSLTFDNFSIFINPIPLHRDNKFDLYRYETYKDMMSLYSNMKGTRKINFSNYVDIPKRDLDYNLIIYKNSRIEQIVDNILMSSIDIICENKKIYVAEDIKKIIFSFFLSFNDYAYGYCYEQNRSNRKIDIIVSDDYSTIIDSFLN